jgi:hypothetical protein
MIDLGHPDEIEVRRLEASSREEAEDIKAELERRGYTVILREAGAGEAAAGIYHADIFAEKRTVPTEQELAARGDAAEKVRKQSRRDIRLIVTVAAVILGLGLLFLLYIMGPLISLIRAVLD